MKIKQCLLDYSVIFGVFLAISYSCKKDDDNNTLTDTRDGNVYKTVTIGSQVWMAENLRYSGNVPHVSENAEWEAILSNSTNQPAWCYYDNNSDNDGTYGKLYNWHAVKSGTLCPPGWHIPTEDEWNQLTGYLGGAQFAGNKMKTATGWESPDADATNASGFSALPGGVRWHSGEFIFYKRVGSWWSSSEDEGSAMLLQLVNLSSIARTIWDDKNHGNSCRCVRD
jgi:uncharacterized protein (TIGR02145 family)